LDDFRIKYHRTTESENGFGWKRSLKISYSNPPAMSSNMFHYISPISCSKPQPTWLWTTLQIIRHLTLFQPNCFSVSPPSIKNFFLMSNLNLPTFCLKLLLLVLSLRALIKSLS